MSYTKYHNAWRYKNNDIRATAFEIAKMGWMLCQAQVDDQPPNTLGESHGNSVLIEHAPLLYEALDDILNCVDVHDDEDNEAIIRSVSRAFDLVQTIKGKISERKQ